MPTFYVIAGPNGGGKSTLTRWNRETFQTIPLLDPDAVARSLTPEAAGATSAIDAGRRVLLRAEELLREQQSFAVETTLSGNTYLRMMAEANAVGFTVLLHFVGTDRVEINMQRVRERVLKGGHDVPEADQRRRFPRSMANLQRAFKMVDGAAVYDNSTAEGHRLVAVRDGDELQIFEPLPAWAGFLRDLV